jgi:SAM-dependent methyltransferase
VRAIDISPFAIRNAESLWGKNSDPEWERADIRDVPLPLETYDAIVAYGLLHCLADPDDVLRVIDSLQRATKPGGYHVICALNSRIPEFGGHEEFNPCLVPHEFYIGAYSHWEILDQSDSDLTEVHPHNGIEHTHSVTRLLTRKSS